MRFKAVILAIIQLGFFVDRTEAISEKIIFESEPVSIESAPWQVSVRLKAYDMEYYGEGHICGGSVISQRVVLSSAHCVVNEDLMAVAQSTPDDEDVVVYRNPDEFILVMGSKSLSEVTQHTLQYQVLQLAVHEAFNYYTLVNNIAMFFINGYIPWNWPTVRAIPLNTEVEIKGMLCSTSGWSITEDNSSDLLRGTLVPIVPQSTCNSIYGELTSDLICAGYEETLQHSFCDGDSGGPLVCLGHLTGIILEGNSCALTGYPGLYVNVLYHYNWIVAHNKTFNYDLGVEHRENHILYDQSLDDNSFGNSSRVKIVKLKIIFLCMVLGIYL